MSLRRIRTTMLVTKPSSPTNSYMRFQSKQRRPPLTTHSALRIFNTELWATAANYTGMLTILYAKKGPSKPLWKGAGRKKKSKTVQFSEKNCPEIRSTDHHWTIEREGTHPASKSTLLEATTSKE